MQPTFDPHRPVFDQDGRKAEIISVSILPMEFPIAAMIQTTAGKRSPMSFDRSGVSRKGSAFYLTNTRARP